MEDAEVPNIVDQTIDLPGWITDLTIDLAHSMVTYRVWVNYEKKSYTITFSGVSAFYFVRGAGARRFEEPFHQQLDDGSWAVSEWTAARYYPNGVGVANVEGAPGSLESQWVGRFPTTPNFAISQLGSIFFIEANRIQVNDQVFEVGYPPGRPMNRENSESGDGRADER